MSHAYSLIAAQQQYWSQQQQAQQYDCLQFDKTKAEPSLASIINYCHLTLGSLTTSYSGIGQVI